MLALYERTAVSRRQSDDGSRRPKRLDASPSRSTWSRAGGSRSRRTILASLATVSAAIAGCATEEDVNHEEVPDPVEERQPIDHRLPSLPVHEHKALVKRGIEAGERANVSDEDTLRDALESEGIAIGSLERDGRFLLLEYDAAGPEVGTLENVGLVAGAYVPFVVESDDPGRLEATLVEPDGTPFGSFDILIKWGRSYHEGELPIGAYAELVSATIETTRETEG